MAYVRYVRYADDNRVRIERMIVPVWIQNPRNPRSGSKVTALFDTGSDVTAIESEHVMLLGLSPLTTERDVTLTTPDTGTNPVDSGDVKGVSRDVFEVDVTIENDIVMQTHVGPEIKRPVRVYQIARISHSYPEIKLLLGMDSLAKLGWTYLPERNGGILVLADASV